MVRLRNFVILAFLLSLITGTVFMSQFKFNVKAQSDAAVIPGRFIVVLKEDNSNPQQVANEMAIAHGLSVDHVYTSAIKGFSATIPQARLAKLIADVRVEFISEDRTVSIEARSGNPKPAPSAPPQATPTGITRIGQNLTNKGTDITVAVIDTGIDSKHPDLASNVIGGVNCSTGAGYQDGNGHGTHVAGTIAALDNSIGVVGVAPEADLLAVRVLNNAGSGSWTSVICGIDWVTSHAAEFNIKVANMSLGGGGSSDNNCGKTNGDALHLAICNSTARGITYVVAAGNDGANASSFVPAAYNDTVITVSALADSDGLAGGVGSSTSYGYDDTFASFSNYNGSIVDIGAPGVLIHSTWKGGGYNTISGTSMAAPHVSGAAALYLKTNSTAIWTVVRDGLVNSGEVINSGHTDPSGRHPEPVLNILSF